LSKLYIYISTTNIFNTQIPRINDRCDWYYSLHKQSSISWAVCFRFRVRGRLTHCLATGCECGAGGLYARSHVGEWRGGKWEVGSGGLGAGT